LYLAIQHFCCQIVIKIQFSSVEFSDISNFVILHFELLISAIWITDISNSNCCYQ